MKFPKLRWLPTISVLFLSGFHFLFGQVLSPPTLSSTHGNSPVISVCNSDTVTFTATGDLGPTANDAEFRIIRAGVILYPLGAPGPQSILSFSSSSLQNGDQVVATVWTYDYGPAGGASSTTNTITISLDDYPLPISFTSDANGNVICENDNVLFSANTASTSTLFQFFVDGISLQGPSMVSTLSHAFSTSSTVTLIASLGNCSRQLELPLQVVSVVPGAITGGGEYCYADIPSPINSFSFGQIDGTNLVTSTSTNLYQWESSVDGVNWSEILNATGLNYTPPSLNQTTHFRRKIRSINSGTICEAVSNQITINVLPIINPGFIEQGDQYFCLNDTFPTLTVTQSTVSAGILYQWQQSTNNGTSYSNIPLATAKEYTPSGLTQTTLFRRATYSNSGSGCVSNTLPIKFSLININAGSLDTSQNSTICNGSVPSTLISGATGADATSAVGTISYQWQQSVDNSNWTTITTATSSSYAPPALTVSTYFRRVAFANTGSLQCSDATNALLISVRNEINAGALLGNQILCENDLPTTLSLSGTTSATGTTYQWQMSTDNANFTTLTNNQPTLSFTTTTTAWNPTVTSYYRVLVRNTVSPGCVATSTTAEIIVNPTPQIIQTSGPGPQQVVCPGDAMINATFSLTGSATTLTAAGLTGTGLTFSPSVGGIYTLSGTPTTDAAITITANGISPCLNTTYQYNVFRTPAAVRPSFIRKGVDSHYNTVFQDSGLWYNNTLCQNTTAPTTTNFFACQNTTSTTPINYEWQVTPASAGTINVTTGQMTWNTAFSGTATVSVRSLGCGGNSAWLDTAIEVIPDTFPATAVSSITQPIAIDRMFCATSTGSIPTCEITANTPNTRFFSTTAKGNNDYHSIQWSIQNVVPGGGITGVTNPGKINATTGEVNWNTGFFGSLDIQAQAVNCDGSLGPTSITTVQINPTQDISPNIITVSPTLIPSCPPQGSYQTNFSSNLEVDWSLSNTHAGFITSTGTNTARLTWSDDFSGTVRIIATANGVCETGSSEFIAIIPGQATIQTLTGLDDVQLCEGENLVGIPYTIGGFPNTASVTGLPSGITGTLSATHHIVDVVYSGTAASGQTYRLEILGQLYEYTTSGVETSDQIVQGLSNVVSASPTRIFNATRTATNTLRFQPLVAGVALAGTVFSIPGSDIVANIITVSSPRRQFILSGVNTAPPGEYVYQITTEGGESFCQQVSIMGKITVVGTSSLTLNAGSDDNQVVCDASPISPISYQSNYATFATVAGLPPGVSYVASSTGVIISGTPTVNVTTTTVYTYTVSTTNNVSGCTPEASLTGRITVEPLHTIELTSALGTDNQTICNSGGVGALTPIEYTFGGGATGNPTVVGLPPGITPIVTGTNKVIISGAPITTVTTETTYPYTITTVGPSCTPITLSGSIVVSPNPSIQLISAAGTDNQTGSSAICDGTEITPIQYVLENTSTFVNPIPGLPNGLIVAQSGNVVTISGSPNVSITSNQVYSFTLTTNGSTCQPEVSVTGQIEVIPIPRIVESFVESNDITHVTCPGSSDGAITIPLTSPAIDLRIQGGLSPTAQIEQVALVNQPALGDEYTIKLNGITYRHTVIASSFGGPVQTSAEVAMALTNEINNATGTDESVVTASYIPTSTIRLVADTPGISFSLGANVMTTVTGTTSPLINVTQIVSNTSTNHSYLWTGPAGFSSSDLQIENLSAGDYTLRVTVGNCSNEATFTINEPSPISAINEVCGGSFKTTISGGTGPYTLMLYDDFGNLLRTDTTNSIYIYSGLTPGANYRLDVVDSNCAIPKQFAVSLPFELQYNPANVELTHDFCQQVPNTGEGSIVLGTVVGNAFSGGSGNFSYRWSGPTGVLLTRDIHNLVSGDYTVTVTDNELGCSRSETFTIASNSPLNLTLAGSSVLNSDGEIELSCANESNGEIQINVTGGFGSYTYAWEKDGQSISNNTNHLQNLDPGEYTVTVTDIPPGGVNPNSLCQLTQTFTIVAPPLLTLSIDQNNLVQPNCSGQTLDIPVSVAGGVPPYSISLNGGMTISTSSPTYIFESIDPTTVGQTVTITVEDQNNCNATPVGININVQAQYVFSGTATNIDCNTDTLGAIQLTAIPSIPASDVLIVEWRGDTVHFFDTWLNGQGRLNEINNPGTYTVSISSQQGCVLYSESFEVENITGDQLQVEILQEISSPNCNENGGRIDLDIRNGIPPYSIQWEQMSSTNSWTILNELNNQAIVTELPAGTYRAIVSDSSLTTNTTECISEITTRNIVLTDNRLSIINIESVSMSNLCELTGLGVVAFELENGLNAEDTIDLSQLSFFIDGTEIPSNSDRISIDQSGVYQINAIPIGEHVLKVIANLESLNCSVEEAFVVVEDVNPIQFSGKLSYEIDICNSYATIEVNQAELSGGVPFTGSVSYDLRWVYTPVDLSNAVTQTYFGSNINNAAPGTYELIITDSEGCQNDPEQPIYVEVVAPEFDPISITGILTNPNGDQDQLVKVIPKTCGLDEEGQIGVDIFGGLGPIEINWFIQDPTSSSNTSNQQGFIPLPEYTNQTVLRNLEAGSYKIEVRSLSSNCAGGDQSIYTFATEVIEVDPNPDLFIVSGPFIDSDLCEGNPGRLSIEVFDNNQGELFFYYEGEQVQVEENPQVNEQTYTLLIPSPVENGILRIVNEEGCFLTKEVNLQLGEPSFSFTSPSLETSGVILAREEIVFENTSTNPYLRSEWIFGDFSPPLVVTNVVTSSSIRHSYPVSGAYNVSLRIYNDAGCFKETSQIISVGSGYSILLPNVFTPNNDGINDTFRPIFSGLSKISFTVYDNLGNKIYNENVAEVDLDNIQGIEIKGWDGNNAPIVPHFIYTVEGFLFDGVTKVEETGTFILLR